MMNEKCRKILAGLKSIADTDVLKDAEQIKVLSEAIQMYESLWQDTAFDEVSAVLGIMVSDRDIHHILMYAFDGGISHWCDVVRTEGEMLGEYASEQIPLGGKVILHDKKKDLDIMLTKEKVLQGIRMYAEHPKDDDIFEMIDHKLWIDFAFISESVADAIIQYAVFSGIIYEK